MLPIQEKIQRPAETSFRIARRNNKSFGFEWHQHPECELTLIESGSGQRFVGDHIDTYHPGELVLLGSDLPHTFASHPPATTAAPGSAPGSARGVGTRHKAVVVQFDPSWLDTVLYNTPEARAIQGLMRRSRCGLRFTGPARAYAAEQMPAMLKLKGMPRVLALLGLLDKLAHSRGVKPLASPVYERAGNRVDRRIDRVCRFIHDHATEPITQAQAAQLIHMSGPAFSRFFRQRVGKTYSRYVHELRIGHACRLLLETDLPITDTCFASGFNNLSNFNRVFRSIKGVSPRRFRQQHATHQA